jgi:hypothetical protein
MLDATFDGDGRVVTDLGADEGAVAVAVLPGGKILVAAPMALVRYDSSGAPDATFDEDGVRVLPGFVAADMAIAPVERPEQGDRARSQVAETGEL